MLTIDELIKETHDIAIASGWWTKPATFVESIALAMCEGSEAIEEWRNHREINEIYYTPDKKGPQGIPVEIADMILRLCDACGQWDIPLSEALELKSAYNKTRAFRHGDKCL